MLFLTAQADARHRSDKPETRSGLTRSIQKPEHQAKPRRYVRNVARRGSRGLGRVDRRGAALATVRARVVLRALGREREANRRLRADLASLRRSLRIPPAPALPGSLLLAAVKIPYSAPAAAFRDVPVGTVVLGALPPEAPRLPPERPQQSIIQPIRVYPRHHLTVLAGFPAPLVRKVEEIIAACGSRVVSAFRPGARVRGSGRPSLHAIKRAVDIVGAPKCAYAKLRTWPGGVSTDYGRVHHIHVSYSPQGREWHARFQHWYSGKTRHARAGRRKAA